MQNPKFYYYIKPAIDWAIHILPNGEEDMEKILKDALLPTLRTVRDRWGAIKTDDNTAKHPTPQQLSILAQILGKIIMPINNANDLVNKKTKLQ